MNDWHETYNDEPGPDVVCGHLVLIASPPAEADPSDACGDCLREGSTWVDLRRCLVCGEVSCCESSAAGFAPVKAGGLDQAIRIEMFGDLHDFGGLNGKLLTSAQARALLTGTSA